MSAEIPVPQVEPRFHSILTEHRQGFEGVPFQTPARGGVRQPGESVHHGIEVGGYVETMKFLVVPGIHPNDEFRRLKTSGQPNHQLRSTDSASQSQSLQFAHRSAPDEGSGGRTGLLEAFK